MEQTGFVGMILEKGPVIRRGLELVQGHASAYPPDEGALFIAAEIMAGPDEQDVQDGPEVRVHFPALTGTALIGHPGDQVQQGLGYLLHGEGLVGHSGRYGAWWQVDKLR